MGESTKEHLKALLESFDTGILITRHREQEHARPMAVAAVEGANTLWFVTLDSSPKTNEIQNDERVSATFQSSRKFVALSGRAELIKDHAKVEQLWQADWKVWFPKGKSDPDITLIRVTVTDAEFWDNSGTHGIRYAFDAAKALLTRTRPTIAAGEHGRIKDDRAAPVSKPH